MQFDLNGIINPRMRKQARPKGFNAHPSYG
jgi:hypothetical protein